MLIDVLENDGKIYINGAKKVLTPLTKDKGFKKKLKQTIHELNELLITYIEANGFDIQKIQEENTDLNDILGSNKYFKDFISKYLMLQQTIESAQYISENPIYAQRKIDKELIELRKFVKELYPNYKTKYKISNYTSIVLSIIKRTLLFTFLFILLICLLIIGYILIQEFLIRF